MSGRGRHTEEKGTDSHHRVKCLKTAIHSFIMLSEWKVFSTVFLSSSHFHPIIVRFCLNFGAESQKWQPLHPLTQQHSSNTWDSCQVLGCAPGPRGSLPFHGAKLRPESRGGHGGSQAEKAVPRGAALLIMTEANAQDKTLDRNFQNPPCNV